MDRVLRKVFLTIIMIIVCGSLFIFSTFVWFHNNSIKSSNIDVTISSLDDITLSVDKKNWSNVLANDDFSNIPKKLEGLSTTGVIDDKKDMSFYKVSYYTVDNKDYYLVKKESSPKVLSLSFYLNSKEDGNLYLSSNSNAIIENLDKSIRVGILEENDLKIIWEPFSDIHTEDGVHKALIYYDTITSVGPLEKKIKYRGVLKEIKKEDKVAINSKSESYFRYVNTKETVTNNKSDIECFKVSKGIHKLKVYLWIESQDVDYDDSYLFEQLNFSLQFKVLKDN